MGTLHEDQYTFMIIYRSILLIKRNISEKKGYREILLLLRLYRLTPVLPDFRARELC
jgi:hypothetical protein